MDISKDQGLSKELLEKIIGILDNVKKVDVSTLKKYIRNNKKHPQEQVDKIATNIKRFGFYNPILVDENNSIIAGHGRILALKQLGIKKAPTVVLEGLSEKEKAELRIWDNKLNESPWDLENVKLEIEEFGLDELAVEFEGMDCDLDGVDGDGDIDRKSLVERFLIPPFSIWDTKQGYRMERKKIWKEKIGDNGESREDTLMSKSASDALNKINGSPGFGGVSILDPVMAECICKFFCIEGGTTFDPFAGDSVFGFVSGTLGLNFQGIELRKEQSDLNQKRCDEAGLSCRYHNDSSDNMDMYIDDNSVDMLFSCPPYWNLEKYSDDPRDLSNKTKDEFYDTIKSILTKTYKKLRDDSFATIVIGEVRDKDGGYINFVGETIKIMIDAGYMYYNEIILATPIGTTAIRVGKQFNSGRKIGKIHQNILVFYKGNPKNIKAKFGALDFSDTDFTTANNTDEESDI